MIEEYNFDDFDICFDEQDKEEDGERDSKTRQTHRRNTECLIRETKTIYRRAFSETQLLDVLGSEFKNGYSYHCITAGDVDSLSYIKCVLRQQIGIETSANINTNPRTENGCITIGKDIFDFYKKYFDGIISFEK